MEQTEQTEPTKYPKVLTLEWLKENNQPLYLRNITRPRGILGVHFLQSGRIKTIKFEPTYLPVCMTTLLGWDTIIGSDDLRLCLSKGVLDIVTPEDAQQELSSESAQIETERMQLSEFSAKQTFLSRRVRDMERASTEKVDPDAPGLQPLGIETNVIQPRILSLVEKLRNKDISIKAALNELKTREAELRETDCSYLIANGPEGQIRNYVQKLLAHLRNASAASYDLRDDDGAGEMTPDEQASESRREAIARQHQRV